MRIFSILLCFLLFPALTDLTGVQNLSGLTFADSLDVSPGYTIPRHIAYRFTLRNTRQTVAKQVEFWTYAPYPHTATQFRADLRASHPFELLTDAVGNQVLHFALNILPPYATQIVTIEADLLLSESPQLIPTETVTANHQSSFLNPEPYCESDDPRLVELAEQLRGDSPQQTAQQIFDWVTGNIRYSGYLKEPRGALSALTSGQGDCTEFMYLFVALCRAARLQARALAGYIVRQNAPLKAAEYHNWAEWNRNGVWMIADPQQQIFQQNQSQYVIFRILNQPARSSSIPVFQRFFARGDGIEVTMQ